MTSVLALIPARGGSKGVPRKNLRPLAGRPLITYSIEQALASSLIDRVIVSTEDREIAEAAIVAGAEVPFMRPAELADDLTPDLPVFVHALQWLQAEEGYNPELVVHLRATSPLRNVALIDDAIRLMLDRAEADAMKSVSRPLQTPYKMWTLSGDYLAPLLVFPSHEEAYNLPRQQLPQVFWQDGYVDIVRPRVILEEGLMHGRKIIPFFTPEGHIEIDRQEDFDAAEAALRSGAHLVSVRRKDGPPRYSS